MHIMENVNNKEKLKMFVTNTKNIFLRFRKKIKAEYKWSVSKICMLPSLRVDFIFIFHDILIKLNFTINLL